MHRSRATAVAAVPLILALAACGGGGEESLQEAAAGPRAESPALGIALASVPRGFEVAAEEGAELTLVRADGTPGSLTFQVAPPARGGVNLVAAVNEHKAEIEARPGGLYKGQIELMSQLGTAYASRGRFHGPGAQEGEPKTEEFRILVIHPQGDRLLSIVYTYPGGPDTTERRDQLLEVLAEVEGLGTPAEAGEGAAAPAGEG